MNITKGSNNYETIECTSSATSDTGPLNVALFTDLMTKIVDETPPASSASKPVGLNSSTISLSVQPTLSEFEQQQQNEK